MGLMVQTSLASNSSRNNLDQNCRHVVQYNYQVAALRVIEGFEMYMKWKASTENGSIMKITQEM